MYVITHTQSLLPYIEKIRPKDKILSIFTPDRGELLHRAFESYHWIKD